MRKGSDVIGKVVVAFDSGERVARIEDVIFDQHTNQILGFLIEKGGWFGKSRVVPWRVVQAIGPDAVIITDKQAVVDVDEAGDIKEILERDNVVKGTKIMTTDGRLLGNMVDLYFDEETGEVEGYEVAGGIFADRNDEHNFVPAPETVKIGQEIAFVPPAVADLMAEYDGAIPPQEVRREYRGGVMIADAPSRPGVDEAMLAELRGRRVRETVELPDGRIIAARGQVVTDRIIHRAMELNQLDALLAAAGLGHDEPPPPPHDEPVVMELGEPDLSEVETRRR